MRKKLEKIYIFIFISLFFVIGIIYIIRFSSETEYSESENRNLAAFPSFSSLLAGSFDEEFEAYLLDHFPARDKVISFSKSFSDLFSIASYEDYVKINSSSVDALDGDNYTNEIDSIINSVEKEEITEKVPDIDVSEPTVEPEDLIEDNTETPAIESKPSVNPDDYPERFDMYMCIGDNQYTFDSYPKANVQAVAAIIDKYASLLPENGKLMMTIVPQSTFANQYVNSNHNGYIKNDALDFIEDITEDNVYTFDAGYMLSSHIDDGEYVFFRTDMHWTPYGSYLVYRDMVERAGKEPCDYQNDFDITVEEPFLGTYYRDNPSDFFLNNADTLELLEPYFPHELRRITGPDQYSVIPFLDFNAKKNDRYTIYIGGPAGPWTYVESDNGQTENCLVMMDSFGLGYLPLLTKNYKQVHYYDPRYFDKDIVGFSVSEMIKKYEITDIYVVIGDLHSFTSDFILTYANKQY